MGISVKSAASHQTKTQYTVNAAEVAATFSIVDGQLGIFIGDSVPQSVALFRLQKCAEFIREQGNTNPTTLQFTSAFVNATDSLTYQDDGALPSLLETSVCVVIGLDYRPAGTKIDAHVQRMFERALEDVLKAA